MTGRVLIVDEQTGRLAEGRQFSKGLHQAIEAKERVKIRKENRTTATITYQNFFKKYRKISGMTGTGKAEEQEFIQIYGMDMVTIPTNRPIARKDKPDVVFRTQREKLEAVCRDAAYCITIRQPVLVGTTVSRNRSSSVSCFPPMAFPIISSTPRTTRRKLPLWQKREGPEQ